MSSVNNHIIVGSVGTINELKGNADMPVFSFSVATSDYAGKGKGDQRDGVASDYATTWHDVTTFGKTAASLEKRLGKGDKVYVSGPLVKETYTKKDGTPGSSVRIKANSVTIVHSKNGAAGTTTEATQSAASVADSDLPF
jgi:single stranded DNA-binding protein